MTLNIQDISPVTLDGSIDTASELDLAHDGDQLSDHNDSLLNELRALSEAQVVVPDFDVGTDTHEMHVWDVLADGSLSTKWSRNSANSSSGPHEDLDIDVLVVAVPPGVSVPTSPAPDGPPEPGTTQKKVRVKISKQGSMPF